MSDATVQAVHDAVAAHIADESDGEILLLTDWQMTVAAAIADDPGRTMYFNVGHNSPYHHRLGLIHRGLEMLTSVTENG